MKIAVISGLLSFILAIIATIFFNGFFNGNNAANTEQHSENSVQNLTNENAELEELQKKILQAKQELEKQRAEIAKEKMKLETIKSKPTEPIELSKDNSLVNNGPDLSGEKISKTGLKQAAKLFASMKPSEAAVILCELDENLTKRIVSEMDTRSAGKVMTALAESNPAYAAKVSKAMLNTGKDTSF